MAVSLAIFLLQCFYFMLPGYFANMAPVMIKKINLLVFPIDFNAKINNKPVLGKNKTFRGLIFGIIFSIIIAYFQYFLYSIEFFKNVSFFNYNNWLAFGILMGLGALSGDMIKSFFKRRVNIKPGNKFIPFDQMDFVIGSFIFIIPLLGFNLRIFIASLLLSFVLDIMVNHLAFYLGIRNEKW